MNSTRRYTNLTAAGNKRFSIYLVCLLCLFLLCGCQRDPPYSSDLNDTHLTPTATQLPIIEEIHIGMVLTPESITHPLKTRARDLISLQRLVYESVIRLDDTGKPQPYLCKNWTVSDDGYEWTFSLNENIVFSDGTPLHASDVVSSLSYIRDFGDSPFYGCATQIDSMVAVDEHTLRVRAVDPSYGILYAMTFPVLRESTLDDAIPQGSGPFLVSSFPEAGNLTMIINDKWWKKAPATRTIVAKPYEHERALLAAYDEQEVELITTRALGGARYRTLGTNTVIDYTTAQFEMILPNLTNSILAEDNVRKAIMMAIDRKYIIQTVYQGCALLSDAHILPGSFLYEPASAIHTFQLQSAKNLLDAADWREYAGSGVREKDGQMLTFELLVNEEPGSPLRKEAATLIAQMLAEIGIEITIVTSDFDDILQKLEENQFDLVMTSFYWDFSPDATDLLRTSGDKNMMRYKNAQMDLLLDNAACEKDETAYIKNNQLVQMKIAQDLPFFPLYFRTGTLVSSRSITIAQTLRELDTYQGLETWGRN